MLFFFNLGSHLTLWCQLLLIQTVRALCETVLDLCKHKLGRLSQTEGCLSVWIIRWSHKHTHTSAFTLIITRIIWWNSNKSVTFCPSSSQWATLQQFLVHYDRWKKVFVRLSSVVVVELVPVVKERETFLTICKRYTEILKSKTMM